MIRINQIKLPVHHTEEELQRAVGRSLRAGSTPFTFRIRRQSLDAREKPDLKYVYTVDVSIRGEKNILKRSGNPNASLCPEIRYHFPNPGEMPLRHRPVIVGSGPAGLFCAWYLANAGYRPIVLERGDDVAARRKKTEAFWGGGPLDPESNVQFGEGGAGTFSDGKLNTLVKDPAGRHEEVLRRFIKAGASPEILYQQKPHLGTDVLAGIIKSLRAQITSMGGEVRFRSKVTDLRFDNGALREVIVNDSEVIEAEVCVLAIGHSARDTYEVLHSRGLLLQPKAFAVGVRVEHPQAMINRQIYGADDVPGLGSASYKLTHKCADGRGVYSFCMCPGGYIVNASSEPGRLAVNGMSYHDRASGRANSALIVTVSPEDFGDRSPLAGISFQRRLEEAAYREGQGSVPVQYFADFEKGQKSSGSLPADVRVKGAYRLSDVRSCLPDYAGSSIIEGIHAFSRTIPGYDSPDVVIAGVESRTSSPVRIVRNAECESSMQGIYPCGEGAGYAGGITSAAMDGMRAAEAIARKYRCT